MSLTKFNENVNNIQGLPDKPTITPEQLKALFDKAGIDIKQYLNEVLTSEIDSIISTIYTKTQVDNLIGNIITLKNLSDRNGTALIGSFKVQWGYLSGLTVPANGYLTETVTFNEEYINVPSVVVSCAGNYNIKADVQSASKTSCNINIRSLDGGERTGRGVYWIAIGS